MTAFHDQANKLQGLDRHVKHCKTTNYNAMSNFRGMMQ